MSKHMNDFQDILNQLASMEISLFNEFQVFILLSSLPNNWETLVVALNNSAPDKKLSIKLV